MPTDNNEYADQVRHVAVHTIDSAPEQRESLLRRLPPVPTPTVVPGGPQEPDLSDAEPHEMAHLEVDIAAYTFGADQETRRRVGVCEVPRLMVPKQVYKDNAWHTVYAQSDDPNGRWRRGQPELEPYNFRLHGLDPEDFKAAEVRATQPVQNGMGMVVRRDRDDALYNAMVVYMATVPEDRTKPGGWDDPKMWQRYQVGNGALLVKTMLLMGELVSALGVVMHMSQFNIQQERLLGNS